MNDFNSDNIPINKVDDIEELYNQAMKNWSNVDITSMILKQKEIHEISQKYDYAYGRAISHLLTGIVESFFLHFDEALKNYFYALKICDGLFEKDTIRTEYENIKVSILNNIGRCYGLLSDLPKSLEYFEAALKIQPKNFSSNNNTGVSYLRMSEYDLALKYFNKSLNIIEDGGENQDKGIILLNIGNVLFFQGRVDEAAEKFKKALFMAQQVEDFSSECSILRAFSKLHLSTGDLDKAFIKVNEALKIAEIKNIQQGLISCYSLKHQIHKQNGDFEQALKYHELYLDKKSILFTNEMMTKIADHQARYDLEKKIQDEKISSLENSKKITEKQLNYFREAYAEVSGVGRIGVFSNTFKHIIKTTELFHKDRSVPVLIEGETGTGKEIIARLIHFGKDKSTAPFIVVNCAAISPSLFESELFGYEEGAFTGARKRGMIGKLELAGGGTIFLDEIGELPLEMQPKLLRVLQQREMYRIGGDKIIKLNVRIICATNRNLHKEVEDKRFRQDLYYRLNTGRIFIPPLRERKEEIAPLSQMFLLNFSLEKKRNFKYIDEKAITILENSHWCGNVRELQNTLERVVLLYNDVALREEHLDFLPHLANGQPGKPQSLNIIFNEEQTDFEEVKDKIFKFVVNKFAGNKVKAAEYLNISSKTLYRRKI